ncbi:MAG: glycosyltransferase [Saprospiraceae bacterium]|nr:glycosyltransferase [Saprospiraceae bacterium]MDW8230005.1 glycosyltransferase [Saprospiraceae bacterium]
MSAVAVHVYMLAYNSERYIAQAIEGVLAQQTDFMVKLFVGEDCSKDSTPEICRAYAEKYPDRVVFLPAERNMGITANTARMLSYCTAKYMAICDGDDVWIDPQKLQKQVDFLESHSDYGASYSDVEIISETGEPIVAAEYEALREFYGEGDVFVRLLTGNFINNSTAVVRRSLLHDFYIDPSRDYTISDYFLWLHVAARAKVHFLPERTTAYRWHGMNASRSAERIRQNQRKYQCVLGQILLDFDRHNRRSLRREEKAVIFRKTLSALYRTPSVALRQRLQLLPLLFRYFPI